MKKPTAEEVHDQGDDNGGMQQPPSSSGGLHGLNTNQGGMQHGGDHGTEQSGNGHDSRQQHGQTNGHDSKQQHGPRCVHGDLSPWTCRRCIAMGIVPDPQDLFSEVRRMNGDGDQPMGKRFRRNMDGERVHDGDGMTVVEPTSNRTELAARARAARCKGRRPWDELDNHKRRQRKLRGVNTRHMSVQERIALARSQRTSALERRRQSAQLRLQDAKRICEQRLAELWRRAAKRARNSQEVHVIADEGRSHRDGASTRTGCASSNAASSSNTAALPSQPKDSEPNTYRATPPSKRLRMSTKGPAGNYTSRDGDGSV